MAKSYVRLRNDCVSFSDSPSCPLPAHGGTLAAGSGQLGSGQLGSGQQARHPSATGSAGPRGGRNKLVSAPPPCPGLTAVVPRLDYESRCGNTRDDREPDAL